jgi:putative inorganic carbon (HCO3(-)) transporter
MRLPAQPLRAFDLRAASWTVAAALLSLGFGLLVGVNSVAAFDVAAVGACAALIAWQPYAALLGLLVLRGTLATSPSSALVDFLVLAAAGLAVLVSARRVPGRRVTLPFLAFLLIALPLVPLVPSWDEGAKEYYLKLPLVHVEYLRQPSNELLEWMRLAMALPVFVWAAWSVRSVRQMNQVVAVVLVSAVYPIVDGLIQVASGRTHDHGGDFGSVTGPFSHPNGFASYLTIVLVLALVAFFEARSIGLRLALGLLLAGGLTCLLFTYTRASWIGFALAVVLLGALRYRRLLLIGLLGVAIVVIASPGTTHKAEQRFSDLSAQSESYTNNSWTWRRKQWSRMIPYGLDRPLTGRGFGGYARDTLLVLGTQDPQLSTKPRKPHGALGFGAHNDYVKALVETGIPGLVLWVLTLTGVIAVAARARRVPAVAAWATAILAVAITLSLVSFADNIQTAPVDMVYLFGLAGAVTGVAARTRRAAGQVAVAPSEPAQTEAEPAAVAEAAVEAGPSESEPEPDAVPAPARPAPSVRMAIGRWLRRRSR